MLCLKPTRIGCDAGERVVQHLAWAVDLLNLSEAERSQDFQREFATYWERSRDGKRVPVLTSIVSPNGPSREIFFFADRQKNEIVFGDDRQSLTAWLRHTGRNPGKKEIDRTWIAWLEEPMLPRNFPKVGSDVFQNLPDTFAPEVVVRPGESLPVLLGAKTASGPVLVGTLADSGPVRQIERGFRPGRVPTKHILQSMVGRPIRRLSVRRADGVYVHGRGHNPEYAALAAKTVAIVGCGALGGAIARLLAQAGVGSFVFIDHDMLGTQNTSRHVLGHRFVGRFKSEAMAEMLREDFPHIQTTVAHNDHVERMPPLRLANLASCNLVISSGIDFVGDAALNKWRLATDGAPPHLCAWVEPFALAGHAIALFRSDDLMVAFDADGHPLLELTRWGKEVQILITEAGCGNVFQPHGAVDLQSSVLVATKLALDILRGTVTSSTWHTWQGERDEVLRHGGIPSEEFVVSNIERKQSWTPKSTLPEDGGA